MNDPLTPDEIDDIRNDWENYGDGEQSQDLILGLVATVDALTTERDKLRGVLAMSNNAARRRGTERDEARARLTAAHAVIRRVRVDLFEMDEWNWSDAEAAEINAACQPTDTP
jgi:hypothetical protein